MKRLVFALGILGGITPTYTWGSAIPLPDSIQVRDRVGGETGFGTPGGYYATGTGSRVRGTAIDGRIGRQSVGLLDFEMKAQGELSFTPIKAFVLDPSWRDGIGYAPQPIDTNGMWYVTVSPTDPRLKLPITPADELALTALFTHAFDIAQTEPRYAAAFQWLVWEYVWDSQVDLSVGNVRIVAGDGSYSDRVADIAQAWADKISCGDWTPSGGIAVLYNGCTAPLIVPSPASGALLLAGFAAFASRRRRHV